MATTTVNSYPSEKLTQTLAGASESFPSNTEHLEHWLERHGLFKINNQKALQTLLVSLLVCVSGWILLATLPWWLLPVGWIYVGTAFTGVFAVGYACSQHQFFQNHTVNHVVGISCLLPLMMNFESWKLHFHTTKWTKHLLAAVCNSPFWFLSSIWQSIMSNFALCNLQFNKRMIANICCLYLFVAIFFPLMAYNVGLSGLVKYYFMPLLVNHYWISSLLKGKFSMENSRPVAYPAWVQLLINNLNYNMANALERIPTYNLEEAHSVLLSKLSNVTDKGYHQAVETYNETAHSIDKFFERCKKINWITLLFLTITPILSIYGLFTSVWHWQTAVYTLITYFASGLAITAGYHRLWAHKAWEAALPVKLFLLFFASSTFEGSCLDWCEDHRTHHRHSDTDKDPYGVHHGFAWAHMGWMMVKRPRETRTFPIGDLRAQKALVFQHQYYPLCAIFSGVIFPVMVCYFGWGDLRGGFFFAAILRIVFVQQATFCINSAAHSWGTATFTESRSSRDSWYVALITCGEGYHNFHHEFPYDYRNGVRWMHYDPSKWLIWILSKLGLAYSLKKFSKDAIEKGRLQMKQKAIEREMARYNWGPKDEDLPIMRMEDVQFECQKLGGRKLLVIEGYVMEVTSFINEHPGGSNFISNFVGQVATGAFNGEIYNHSNAARNILRKMRVAHFAH